MKAARESRCPAANDILPYSACLAFSTTGGCHPCRRLELVAAQPGIEQCHGEEYGSSPVNTQAENSAGAHVLIAASRWPPVSPVWRRIPGNGKQVSVTITASISALLFIARAQQGVPVLIGRQRPSPPCSAGAQTFDDRRADRAHIQADSLFEESKTFDRCSSLLLKLRQVQRRRGKQQGANHVSSSKSATRTHCSNPGPLHAPGQYGAWRLSRQRLKIRRFATQRVSGLFQNHPTIAQASPHPADSAPAPAACWCAPGPVGQTSEH